MGNPSYPAARSVATRLEERIASSTAAIPPDTPKPDRRIIEEVITAAFWASFRREEGRTPRISLAFMPPEQSARPLKFEQSRRLEPEILARLAPAVEHPGIHIGLWVYGDELRIWGLTRTVPTWCFVLEVVAPGLLVVKYRREEPSSKFANVAVLEGADVKFIEQQAETHFEAPPVLGSLLNFYSSAGRHESDNLLIRVATSMRVYGRGGSLLVVPSGSRGWLTSIVQPLTYSLIPPFPDISALLQHEDEVAEVSPDVLQFAVDALTGLTAVDGATVISDCLEPLAFGVKIMVPEGGRHIERVLLTEPIEGIRDTTVDPSLLGGTRHLSAAQFAHDQRDAVTMVASQDGRFTVFAWSPVHEMVHAFRLEALLM